MPNVVFAVAKLVFAVLRSAESHTESYVAAISFGYGTRSSKMSDSLPWYTYFGWAAAEPTKSAYTDCFIVR